MSQTYAPNTPPGWEAKWSPEHNAWYYLNTTTQESVWELPANAYQPSVFTPSEAPGATDAYSGAQAYTAQGQYPLTPPINMKTEPQYGAVPASELVVSAPDTGAYGNPAATAPGYFQQPPSDVPQDDQTQNRGLFGKMNNMTHHMPHLPQMNTATKVALGVGAGLLVGGAVEHAIDTSNYGSSGPHFHQQHHQHHHGGLLGALGGGLAGGGIGGAIGAMTGQGQSNNAATNTSTGGWMGGGMAMGGPKLHILSANYGGGDVTDKVRALVTPDQCIHLNDEGSDDVYNDKFGNHWGGISKSLIVLYHWQGRPLELAIAAQAGGGIRIDHRDHVRPNRRAFITECGPVIAVVWGIMENRFEPVPAHRIQEIASYRSFRAENDYFGFDGWNDNRKTAVVFARDGGRIYNIAVREGGTGTL